MPAVCARWRKLAIQTRDENVLQRTTPALACRSRRDQHSGAKLLFLVGSLFVVSFLVVGLFVVPFLLGLSQLEGIEEVRGLLGG